MDSEGNVFVTGDTQSTNFPVTANALQAQNRGGGEAFVVLLSADFSRLLYSTYLGGPANDNGRSGFLGSDGSLYVTGSSDGPGWPAQECVPEHVCRRARRLRRRRQHPGQALAGRHHHPRSGQDLPDDHRLGGGRLCPGTHRSGLSQFQGHPVRPGGQRSRHQSRPAGDSQRHREQPATTGPTYQTGADRLPDLAQPAVRDGQRQRGPAHHQLVRVPVLANG